MVDLFFYSLGCNNWRAWVKNDMKFYQAIIRLVESVGALIISAAAIIYFSQVIFRFVFNAPLSWSDEVCGHLVVAIAFVGSVLVLHEKGHIAVNILTTHASESICRYVEIVADLLVLAFCSLTTYYGTIVAVKSMKISSSTYPIPLGVIYSCIPICFFIMSIITVIQILTKCMNSGHSNIKKKSGFHWMGWGILILLGILFILNDGL